jgi:hypothetical protein
LPRFSLGCVLPVFHVVLDAGEAVLRARITASDEAQDWRLAHTAAYRDARPWLCREADLVVDTAVLSAAQAAHQIVTALPRLTTTHP